MRNESTRFYSLLKTCENIASLLGQPEDSIAHFGDCGVTKKVSPAKVDLLQG